jgi:hypothetical protein
VDAISSGTRRYSGSLAVGVDSRNEPRLTLDILKQAAMTCPSILEEPAPSTEATEIKGDRLTYAIYFSTASISSVGEARSQLITQLYKRARPAVAQGGIINIEARLRFNGCVANLFFPGERIVASPRSTRITQRRGKGPTQRDDYQASLSSGRTDSGTRYYRGSSYFISFGVLQGMRRFEGGRLLKLERVGPGDSFVEISLLAGNRSQSDIWPFRRGLKSSSISMCWTDR